MEKLSSTEIRNKWIEYFKNHDHLVLDSYSLIPKDDDSLLFVNAGVVPLKKYFDGREVPKSRRLASIQKCIRTNDIDNIGVTKRHLTFFEMMGNFSIGDYFKKEAIHFSYDFLINELKVPKELIYVTVYIDDLESKKYWIDEGLAEDHIIMLEGNYWEIGEGPCGPDTEIFFDRGEKYGGSEAYNKFINDEEQERYIEIWNNVFSQFNSEKDKTREEYKELPFKNIDTGAGLERWCVVFQEVDSVYDTDLFRPIIEKLEEKSGIIYDGQKEFKIIADHIRTVTMALADGADFGNSGRDYVLRRLLRRSIRMMKRLNIKDMYLHELASIVVLIMKDSYPYLLDKVEHVKSVILREEQLFENTLSKGEKILEKLIDDAKSFDNEVSAHDVFKLYDTYGFPYDLTLEYLEEEKIEVDKEKALEYLKERQDLSRKERSNDSSMHHQNKALLEFKKQDKFIYDQYENETKVLAIFDDDKLIEKTNSDSYVILEESVFYGESGGQKGDRGIIKNDHFKGEVLDTLKAPHKQNLLKVKVLDGTLKIGDKVEAFIDRSRRLSITKHHSATHLLQKALQEVLSYEVKQAGSLVDEDYFRFDFTYSSDIRDKDIIKIENVVNYYINKADPRIEEYMKLDDAIKKGAMHLFEDKYLDEVRVISFGDSIELCGGCHVKNTKDIKKFAIYNYESKGSNVYRIEAACDDKIKENIDRENLKYIKEIDKSLNKAKDILEDAKKEDINLEFDIEYQDVDHDSFSSIVFNKNQSIYIKDEVIDLENRYLDKLNQKELAKTDIYLERIEEENGLKYLILEFKDKNMESLKTLIDDLTNQVDDLFVFIINRGEKVSYIAKSNNRLSAVYFVKLFSKMLGGGGGGKDSFASGGASNNSSLDLIIDEFKKEIIKYING